MPLDPTARVLIDAMEETFPPLDPTLSGTEMRALVEQAGAAMGRGAAPEPVGDVVDRTVPGPGGEIPVRIYRPAGPALATIVFFHGGGFVLCDLDSHDGICRALCNATPAVVIAVHYRRAPESRCPAAAEDCYAVALWASRHTRELNLPDKFAVVGDSAGGNLAASVALMARDRADSGAPALAGSGARLSDAGLPRRYALAQRHRRRVLPAPRRGHVLLGRVPGGRLAGHRAVRVTELRGGPRRARPGARGDGRVRPAARRG